MREQINVYAKIFAVLGREVVFEEDYLDDAIIGFDPVSCKIVYSIEKVGSIIEKRAKESNLDMQDELKKTFSDSIKNIFAITVNHK